MSITTNFNIQLMKNRDILLKDESINDLLDRISKTITHRDPKFPISPCLDLILEKVLVLGTPILTNLGREKKPTSACTVIPVDLKQNLSKIQQTIAPYFRNGMGSGFNLDDLSDPVDMLKKLNQLCLSLEKEHLSRPPACMGMLRVDHPKIIEFIRCKRDADFSLWRFNLGVNMSKEFMECVRNNQPWVLHDENGHSEKTIPANDLFNEIVFSAHYCGEPGILFMERYQQSNPVEENSYTCVAPCAEIALAPGEVCQFSYINLAELVNQQGTIDELKLIETTKILVRLLDDVVQVSIDNSEETGKIIAAKRKIGIGICGVADLLIKLKIPYSSSQAIELIANIISLINYHSKNTSSDLAKERGEFPDFPKSRYLNFEWFQKFAIHPTAKITQEMWLSLYEKIKKQGLRNATTCVLPPTGTSSRIIETSTSIEPRFALVDDQGKILSVVKKVFENLSEKKQADLIQTIEKEHYLLNQTMLPSCLKDVILISHQIPLEAQMNMLCRLSHLVDESISKTINLPRSATPDMVRQIFWKTYLSDLKGITIFRDQCLDVRTR